MKSKLPLLEFEIGSPNPFSSFYIYIYIYMEIIEKQRIQKGLIYYEGNSQ